MTVATSPGSVVAQEIMRRVLSKSGSRSSEFWEYEGDNMECERGEGKAEPKI